MVALTNEQYISALPANGLALAEEYLEHDFETLQENDFPVSDTVTGLLLIHTLTSEQEESAV